MNRLIRRGRNTFAIVLLTPIIVIFALALAKPSDIAAQPLPLLEKVGERYAVIARSNSGINCYGSDLSDAVVVMPRNALWAQVMKVSNLPEPVSTEISCAKCHCDTCDAAPVHSTESSRGGNTNILTLQDFLNQGQYAPLLTAQHNN